MGEGEGKITWGIGNDIYTQLCIGLVKKCVWVFCKSYGKNETNFLANPI